MATENFTLTTAAVAREAGCSDQTVRGYSKRGLIEYRLASNGTRLYSTGAPAQVRDLVAAGIARRGFRRQA